MRLGAGGSKDRRHAVADLGHKIIARNGDDGEGSLPLSVREGALKGSKMRAV